MVYTAAAVGIACAVDHSTLPAAFTTGTFPVLHIWAMPIKPLQSGPKPHLHAACVYIAIDISGFIYRLQNWSHFNLRYPCTVTDGRWRAGDCVWWILDWSVGILTELAIFELSEASGCLCFMDYISVSYGLDTSLANCVKLGEVAGQWAQPVRNLWRSSVGVASYVRNEEGDGVGGREKPGVTAAVRLWVAVFRAPTAYLPILFFM